MHITLPESVHQSHYHQTFEWYGEVGTEAYNLAIAFFVNHFDTSLYFHYQVCILEAFWKYKMKELSHNFFKNLPSNFKFKGKF